MKALKAGTIQELKVARVIETGYVLTNGKAEVLMHLNETEGKLSEGEETEVFLYFDKKGQLTATMALPAITLDSYGWAEVEEVVKGLGVFVNIGVQKGMLVSKDDLPLKESVWPEEGDELFVTLRTDKKGRLLAKPVTEGIVEEEYEKAPETLKNEEIGGRVYRSAKIGSFLITEEGYRGFIHHTERKKEPRLGSWVTGRVIEVKQDGTINVSLRPLKQEGMSEDAEDVLAYLRNHGGVMPYTDKSSPEEVREVFNISKASFKRALGKLMKEKKIEQKDGKTILTEEE
ncbi:S1-like domain-containing RNA-binding protein [Evansella sp. LMS18]|uniref:CvfB family protein n=1 Tax=Evansella sp. LMS18 TaxID=2924033 RepID=UPI0020D1E05F|nr:S1-like domain-containing RNA-binding protein [Evansella sp. LMS18]UTR09825.1 S1-like domain-containing RNA-binding protein [Evansella sp. LMS18]